MMDDKQTRLVKKLYQTHWGRILLMILTKPWVSKLAGHFMDSRLSRVLIPRFITSNNIDMDLYEDVKYASFNDFFTRKIKSQFRPIEMNHNVLIAPCDGFLSVHKIDSCSLFEIKGQNYSMDQLVRDSDISLKYHGGTLLVFRLTVTDYHRYHYPDSGIKDCNTKIPGVLHTVNPSAAQARNIYCENSREYYTIHTDSFGDILMMQVGALLVGEIRNAHQKAVIHRGQEAGHFAYGGSTIILCLEKGMVEVFPEFSTTLGTNNEVSVKMGQPIGKAFSNLDN